MTRITNLPDNTLMVVFRLLDGRSLASCQNTCVFWYNIIASWSDAWKVCVLAEIEPFVVWFLFCQHWGLRMQEYSVIWTNPCVNYRQFNVHVVNGLANRAESELSSLANETLRSDTYKVPSLLSRKSNVDCKNGVGLTYCCCRTPSSITINNNKQLWKRVYSTWCRSAKLESCVRLTKLINSQRKITTVKAIGDFIVAGEYDGVVSLWNSISCRELGRCKRHKQKVGDIALYRITDDSHTEHECWCARCHIVIALTVSPQCDNIALSWINLRLGSIEAAKDINHTATGYYSVSCGKEMFAVRNIQNRLVVWNIETVFHQEKPQPIIDTCIPTPRCISLWSETIYCLDEHRAVTCALDGSNAIRWQPTVPAQNTIWRDRGIVVCGPLFIAVNGFNIWLALCGHKFNHFAVQHAGMQLSLAAVCGNLLAVGTEDGQVYIYFMNISSLTKTVQINPNCPVARVKLDRQVFGLELGLGADGTYYLVAMTTDGMLLNRWLQQSDSIAPAIPPLRV